MRRAAFVLLGLYVFTLPWEHSIDLGAGIGSISRVAGMLAMAAGLIAVAIQGGVRRMTLFHATVGVFYLLMLASSFWTVDAPATAMAIRAFPQEVWIVWLIWEFAPDSSHRAALMFSFVAGGYVTALLTIRDYTAATIFPRSDIRFSPDGWNPNELAILMALGIPMAAGLLCRPQKFLVRAVALGYLLLAPMTVVLAGSRGGLAAMTIAAISVPVILGRRGKLRLLAAVVLLAAISVATFALTPANSWRRLATVGSEAFGGNLNDRLSIWRSGLRTFEASSSNTLIGVGADGFLPAVGLGYAAHNTYLSILVGGGLAGFAIFSLLLIQVIAASLQASVRERGALLFCLACWMVAATGGIWEHLRPTWFLFGLIAASRLNDRGKIVSLSAPWNAWARKTDRKPVPAEYPRLIEFPRSPVV